MEYGVDGNDIYRPAAFLDTCSHYVNIKCQLEFYYKENTYIIFLFQMVE